MLAESRLCSPYPLRSGTFAQIDGAMRCRIVVTLIALAVFPCFLSAALTADVGSLVAVAGARPHGNVKIVAYGHYLDASGADTEFEFANEAIADESGHATFQPAVIPFQSIWIVESSGEVVVATRREYTPVRAAVSIDSLTSSRDAVLNDSIGAVVWVLRPSGGRWRAVMARGTVTGDENARGSARVRLGVSKFSPSGGNGSAIDRLVPGDVVVSFGFDMTFWVLQLPPA